MRFCLIFCLFLSVTAYAKDDWPVFCDAEKPPDRLAISNEALSLASYTNDFPCWNYNLLTPRANINSAETRVLGKVGDLRVVEVQLTLTDIYYTDTLMILQEVKPDRFLPAYVQIYNHGIRMPSDWVVTTDKTKLIIHTSMDYDGTGHLHARFTITLSPNHKPTIVESDISSPLDMSSLKHYSTPKSGKMP